jgi:hypothetical protein
MSRASAVGITTGYGWTTEGSEFLFRYGHDRLWGTAHLLYNGYQRFFSEGKAAGALS